MKTVQHNITDLRDPRVLVDMVRAGVAVHGCKKVKDAMPVALSRQETQF